MFEAGLRKYLFAVETVLACRHLPTTSTLTQSPPPRTRKRRNAPRPNKKGELGFDGGHRRTDFFSREVLVKRTVGVLDIVEVGRAAEQSAGEEVCEEMSQNVVRSGPFGGTPWRLLVHGNNLAGEIRVHGVVSFQCLHLLPDLVATPHNALFA